MRFPSYQIQVLLVVICCTSVWAEAPKPALTAPIDESRLVTLEGNTPPAALRAANDRGPIADNFRFDHLLLLLKRAPETEASLRQHIDAMHDPASAQFHRWLTPRQLGERYGAAAQDRDSIGRWLESHGFSVSHIYQSGR